METFCTSTTRNKCKTVLTTNSFYHAPLYARNLARQTDYNYPTTPCTSHQSIHQTYGRKSQSDYLWGDERKCTKDRQKRNQICSIILTAAIFLVAIAVLTIAGLAFYMGALTNDTTNHILIKEAQSRKSTFRNIKIDVNSITVKRYLDNDQYSIENQRNENIPKPKTNLLRKPNQNLTHTAVNTKPIVQKKIVSTEMIKNEESLPMVQGSFTITKTDADITEKKNSDQDKIKFTTRKSETTTRKVKPLIITTTTTEKTKTPPTTTTTRTTTTLTPNLTTASSTKFVFVDEPWKPIESPVTISNIQHRVGIAETVTSKPFYPHQQFPPPIYKSYTNPSLTDQNKNKNIGLLSVGEQMRHPIPVDKFTNVQSNGDSYVEIETLKYVPGSAVSNNDTILSNWQLINDTKTKKIYNDTLQAIVVTVKNEHTTDESTTGQGLVEVVNSTMQELLMKRSETSTKPTFVTLIPGKSNSGLRSALRPRPKTSVAVSETRSFSTDFNLQKQIIIESNLFDEELVNSTNSEISHLKILRNRKDKLNIATTNETSTKPTIVINVISSVSNTTNKKSQPESLNNNRIKKLAKISNLYGNNLTEIDVPVISTKAVLSSTYTTNQAGLKILTKTFNKIPNTFEKDDTKITLPFNSVPLTVFSKNDTKCDSTKVKCGDGTCLPQTTRCNQLMDCPDGSDENGCTCADYLRSQFMLRKICDGIIDCWDFSDENNCNWCSPGQYICLNTRTCIDREKICDGIKDCSHGDDERQCVLVAPDKTATEALPYNSKGYLMIRKYGNWGKLCTENFERFVVHSHASWQVSDLGRAVCKAMTYQDLDYVERIKDTAQTKMDYYELTFTEKNQTESNLSFEKTECPNQEVVEVKCKNLECGIKPQTTNHWARMPSRRSRIVGGNNANLGSWPWQAALYKEGEFQCGATLISDIWLISAGHCFYHAQEDYWVARLGALRRGTTFPSPYEQLRSISKIFLHPDYVDVGFINDISLLRMESSIIFSDYVRPICLPPAGSIVRNGRICTVVGWGQLFEVGRIFPDTLQEVQLPVISTSECRKKTLFLPLYQVTDNMFCAGYDRGGRDACLGDSGGPLMCQENSNRWSLYGVTSNGYGCARANRPGVYTKVASYLEWITSHMNENKSTIANSTEEKQQQQQICKGHRCPLGECLPKSRICNGYIECNDGSDEKDCFNK